MVLIPVVSKASLFALDVWQIICLLSWGHVSRKDLWWVELV